MFPSLDPGCRSQGDPLVFFRTRFLTLTYTCVCVLPLAFLLFAAVLLAAGEAAGGRDGGSANGDQRVATQGRPHLYSVLVSVGGLLAVQSPLLLYSILCLPFHPFVCMIGLCIVFVVRVSVSSRTKCKHSFPCAASVGLGSIPLSGVLCHSDETIGALRLAPSLPE